MTPEEKRDSTVAAIKAAGGVVLACDPLAQADDVQSVVAYRIRAGARSPAVLEAVRVIQADTAIRNTGRVPWQPEPIEGDEEGLL